MSNLYNVIGFHTPTQHANPAMPVLNIVVRADSYEEAGDIARDVAQENLKTALQTMPELKNVKELDVEINVLAEPIGKGYLYPTSPTIKRRVKLHE